MTTSAPDDQILALWRRDWLLTKRQAETTIEICEREVRKFRESLGGRSLSEATRIDVEMFVTTKLETSSHVGRLAQRSLRSLYRWLRAREVVDIDPTAGMPVIREERNPTPATVADSDMEAFPSRPKGRPSRSTPEIEPSSRCCGRQRCGVAS